jgi:hypothetical protein
VSGSRSVVLRCVLACVVAVTALGACRSEAPSMNRVVAAESTMQPDDRVDLTVYFRSGRGEEAHLAPVTREVAVSDDLPRTAIELLIEGPDPDGAEALHPVLPPTTRIHSLTLDGDTAALDLSREVVDDAATVGNRPEHEALALAAIADTLTEFPDISRVHLTVDGEGGGPFWGAWGLPDVLVRDERAIDPQSPGHLSSGPEGFSRRKQSLGMDQNRRQTISAVRARPSATFLRVTVEVVGHNGRPLVGPVPRSTVRRAGDDIVLTVRGNPRGVDTGNLGAKFSDPAFDSARVRVTHDPAAVVITVTPKRSRPFKLHTLADPARVVLDIRR